MAILKDPLFSEEARGQIAKTAVFKRAKVHPVLCAFFYHPVNWTTAKIAHAQVWKMHCNTWRALPAADQEAWRSVAPGVLTGFNYFIQLKGVLPLPPCYKSPAGDLLLYAFTLFPYAPPAGDFLSFEWEECI